MPHQATTAAEVLRVDAVDVAHQALQVGLPRMQHKMEVVAHLAVGQRLRVEAVHRLCNHSKLRSPVNVVPIDRLAPVTA